jgi:hypothetical protein
VDENVIAIGKCSQEDYLMTLQSLKEDLKDRIIIMNQRVLVDERDKALERINETINFNDYACSDMMKRLYIRPVCE